MLAENLLIAKSLKEQIDTNRPLSKDKEQRIMQKFRLDWNYNSNNLEGNSLTYGETQALILFGITAQGKPLKDHFEIAGHDEAIKWVEEIVRKEIPMTEKFIRELHMMILKEPHLTNAKTPNGELSKKRVEIGRYKSKPNHVITVTGEPFYFATPEETPAKMNDLMDWYNQKILDNLNPILIAAEFHYKFVRIHPFDDGNGRIARILMNFILMQYGYPPVIIKSKDKQNYISALHQADSGLIEVFFDYVCTNLISSLELMLKGARGENIDETDDLDKELILIEKELDSKADKVDKVLSYESLQNFIDEVLPELNDKLMIANKKFARFYVDYKQNTFLINNPFQPISSSKTNIQNVATPDSHNQFKLVVRNDFNNFNRVELKHISYSVLLTFYFNQFTYNLNITNQSKVKSIASDEFVLEKTYTSRFTSDQIHKILNQINKNHLSFIKQVVDEYNSTI